jgi:hypothetical protein
VLATVAVVAGGSSIAPALRSRWQSGRAPWCPRSRQRWLAGEAPPRPRCARVGDRGGASMRSRQWWRWPGAELPRTRAALAAATAWRAPRPFRSRQRWRWSGAKLPCTAVGRSSPAPTTRARFGTVFAIFNTAYRLFDKMAKRERDGKATMFQMQGYSTSA